MKFLAAFVLALTLGMVPASASAASSQCIVVVPARGGSITVRMVPVSPAACRSAVAKSWPRGSRIVTRVPTSRPACIKPFMGLRVTVWGPARTALSVCAAIK